MGQIKLGLIGLGKWPREAYLPNLAEMDRAQVVAVAAASEQTREYARTQFGDGLTTYADYRDLLQDDSIEALMIAVPNPMHAQVVQEAAASGKHLFFEPPIGLDEQEIADTLAALEQTAAVVQIDHEIRYTPVMIELQRRLADGQIGEPLMAAVRLGTDWGIGEGWGESVESQGFFLWLGCWYLDMLDCVFSVAPQRVDVVGGRAMNGALMDHGCAVLQYPQGFSGVLEFSLVNRSGEDFSIHVWGTEGEMWAEVWQGTLRWRTGEQWQETVAPCHQPPHGFAGMYESIAGFIGAIDEQVPVVADLDVIRRVHQAALACSRSEKNGQGMAVTEL
ncbi:MAG: Gfo/Idh/MocA family oxidoreductase [candidate division WS1 bacterium]|jgi:predicted dehydrogenase|nr:Gfo/Idh/MocA family oxidoreductase [candidate division WS1 bacterium]